MVKPSLSPMKKSHSALLGLLASVGLIVGAGQSALAQDTTTTTTTNPQPLSDLSDSSRGDIFSNRGDTQGGSMLDIIHRAIQGQGRSPEEFSQEQGENLDSAAAEYKKLQQQRLNTQTTPSATPGQAPTSN